MTRDEVFAVVKANVQLILPDLPPDAISMDQSLKDLGANSIDRMDIVVNSMEELGVKVPLTNFAAARNIGGVVDLLHEAALGLRR